MGNILFLVYFLFLFFLSAITIASFSISRDRSGNVLDQQFDLVTVKLGPKGPRVRDVKDA